MILPPCSATSRILEDKVRQLQKSQDEKNAALTALVQQAVDASSRVSASMATLQKNLADSLNASLSASMNDQQNKIVAPMAVLKTRLDDMSGRDRHGATELSATFRRSLASSTTGSRTSIPR